MAAFIYALCAATSSTCALLLLRSYFRSRYRLLLWAGLCFVGITANNILVVVDKIFFVQGDLLTLRLLIVLLAVLFLLYGLIFDE